MSWQDILKKKKLGIHKNYKKIINSVMTDKPKTPKQIVDLIYDEIDRRNKQKKSGGEAYTLSARYVPSARELAMYFKLDPNYASVILNKRGQEVQNKGSGVTHYYKI